MSRDRVLVWEWTDRDGLYRVTVTGRSWDGLFEVELWRRGKTEGPDTEVLEYWSPLKPMSLADTEPRARKLAKQRLERVSGEPVDLTPDPITVAWVRAFSGDPSADFIDPSSVEVRSDSGPIDAVQIIRLSDLFLVREDASQPDWWMGSESAPGQLFCWGVYGNLYDAIESL